MKALILDASVLVYAAGGQHPQREPSRWILRQGIAGNLILHASVEAVLEFVHHRLRRGDEAAVGRARELSRLLTLHPFDGRVLDLSLDLIASSRVRGRDAVHAATALLAGFDAIVSTDTDFDGVPGLRRIDPADLPD